MLTITKSIKQIENIFSSYFNINHNHFDLHNIHNTTNSMIGLLHVFVDKKDDYKTEIEKYNKQYNEVISSLDIDNRFNYEFMVYSVIKFYNEEIEYYNFDLSEYYYLSDSESVISLSNLILFKNNIDVSSENYFYFRKIALFITIKYLTDNEITKLEIGINKFFKHNKKCMETLAINLKSFFNEELEIFYGNSVNEILIENAIFEVNDLLWKNLIEGKIYDDIDNFKKGFSLIYKVIEVEKIDLFAFEFLTNNSYYKNSDHCKYFKLIILDIFNNIIKFR